MALVGLSGVGKSTLLASSQDKSQFLHVQASELIKLEQAARGAEIASSEALRLGPVIDNQRLLVAGFRRATRGETRPIVFDGHTIIDGSSGIIEIGSDVFGDLGVKHVVMLVADPEEILRRRASDTGRTRPMRSIEQIAAHQDRATEVAKQIADDLKVEFGLVTQSEPERIWHAIESLRT
ncbi:adenylate kinase [Brevundimonas sp. 374]|nr:adenylate kinase [Brevundimonas sp. 374]